MPAIILIMSVNNTIYCQNGDEVITSDTTLSLTIEISTLFPDNTVFPIEDSVLNFYLFEEGMTNGKFLKKICVYNEAESLITVIYDSLSAGEYSLEMAFERFDIKKLTCHLDLKSDTTINLTLKPSDLYEVEARAIPKDFEIYCGYFRRSQSDKIFYSKCETNIIDGVAKFFVLGTKNRKWKIKIRRNDDPDSPGTEINREFYKELFNRVNPFRKSDMIDFGWLQVERLE